LILFFFCFQYFSSFILYFITESSAPQNAKIEEKNEEEEEEEEEEEVDENDPLWIAVLELTNGDRKRALRMLEDPDSLLKYPNIRAIMDSQVDNENEKLDDWEKLGDDVAKIDIATADPSTATGIVTTEKKSSEDRHAKADNNCGGGFDEDGDEEQRIENDIYEDSDPREHVNIVFIGHVDAGKSTLSGRQLITVAIFSSF
jgi:hypothetical protein